MKQREGTKGENCPSLGDSNPILLVRTSRFFSFSHIPHLIHLQILLSLPSKYLESDHFLPSPLLPSSLSQYYCFPRLRQLLPNSSPVLPLPSLLSVLTSVAIPSKYKSD